MADSARTLGLFVLSVASVVALPVFAQPRELVANGAGRCGLHARPLVPQSAAIPDPRTAPAAVLVDGGLLVAWRTVDGALMLSRLDTTLERRFDDRELSRQAGPFAMTSTAGGAAIVIVQRSRDGDDTVLVARESAAGEARNVPRLVGRAPGIDGVAVAPSINGFTVAWGVPGGPDPGTYAVMTDAHGVPVAGAHRVLDATLPRVTYLPAAQMTAVDGAVGAGEPELVLLDAGGNVSERTGWPPTTHGLVASPSGGAVIAMQLAAPPDELPMLSLVRWAGGSTLPVTVDLPARFPAGSWLVDASPDRLGALVAVDDPTGRETIVRAGLDGTVAVLAVRPGSLGSIVALDDGRDVIVGHEPPPAGRGRIALVQLVCSRGPDAVVEGLGTGANASRP